jgi:hypothetical protein
MGKPYRTTGRTGGRRAKLVRLESTLPTRLQRKVVIITIEETPAQSGVEDARQQQERSDTESD